MHERKKGRGIVLHSILHGEADRIVEIFSEEGRFSVLAKGIRKQNAKFSGSLQHFSVISYEILSSSSSEKMPILVGVKIEKKSEYQTPFFLASSSLLAEISRVFLPFHFAHLPIFHLWEEWLSVVPSKISVFAFFCRFFSTLGMFPTFQTCRNTQKKFEENDIIFWDFSSGVSAQHKIGKPFSFSMVKIFAFCSRAPLCFSQYIVPNGHDHHEMWDMMWAFYKYQTPFFPRSKKFWEECS